MELIDKSAVVAEIENLLDKGKYHEEFDCAYRDGNNDALYALKDKLNTLKPKGVDLEKAASHYLLHDHVSPLNKVFHKADIKTEIQYHKDIENAFKAGFKLGLKAKEK